MSILQVRDANGNIIPIPALKGTSMRCGEWTDNTAYYNNDQYIDFVTYNNNFYYCKISQETSYYPPSNTTYWGVITEGVDTESIQTALSGKADLDVNGKVNADQIPILSYIPTSDKGVANGVASLNENNKLEQMPTASDVRAADDLLNKVFYPPTSKVSTVPLFDVKSITYGKSKFVAIASGSNKALYSADGITWTQTTMPVTANWISVIYDSSKFVAIASGSNIAAYSADGITWTQTTMPATANWSSVKTNYSKFVAIASNSNIAAYSTDGITWTKATLPATANWTSVAYGNGKFVAIAIDSNIVDYSVAAYSTDGITWTQTTIPLPEYTSATWTGVIYGNGKFITANDYGTIVAYSTDGINWAFSLTGVRGAFKSSSICFGNGRFILTECTYGEVYQSVDGINWVTTLIGRSSLSDTLAVAYSNGCFVYVFTDGNVLIVYLSGNIQGFVDSVAKEAISTQKGSNNGIASLDTDGKVPIEQMPNVMPEIATQVEAEAGTDDTKMMTPLKTNNFYNSKKATQAQAEEGTDDNTYMTPLTTKQAINSNKSYVIGSYSGQRANSKTINVGFMPSFIIIYSETNTGYGGSILTARRGASKSNSNPFVSSYSNQRNFGMVTLDWSNTGWTMTTATAPEYIFNENNQTYGYIAFK